MMLAAELSQTYLVYLTTIIAFTFSNRRLTGNSSRRSALWVASGLSAGFNLLILGSIVSIALAIQNVEDAVPFVELVSAYGSPVVAPAIAFFFARPESTE